MTKKSSAVVDAPKPVLLKKPAKRQLTKPEKVQLSAVKTEAAIKRVRNEHAKRAESGRPVHVLTR